MKKLQLYMVAKFESGRLKDVNYNLSINLKELKENGEIVHLAESELIRIINRIKKVDVGQSVRSLLKNKRDIKKLPDSKENRNALDKIEKDLDKLLFIPEIINIHFTDDRHYNSIINNLKINNKKYVRLLTGSGMARRSTVMFVEEKFGKELKRIIDNDRDLSVKMVPAKYAAYFALVSSATHSVNVPNYVVIKDYKYTKDRLVDFVVEPDDQSEDYVEERFIPIESNAFDGQGLISPKFAKIWSKNIGLDYVPNSFCIRGSYLKGQCVVFDFHLFAKENNVNKIIDIWGNEYDVSSIDCILTESQLKLWSSYKSKEHYQSCCDKNGIGWGVSLFTPKVNKDTFFSSYQLLQVLDLNDEQIYNLCKPTLNWLQGVSCDDVDYALLYLLGEICNREEIDTDWFDKLDHIIKALTLNHRLFSDPYIKKYLYKSINLKIKESRMGKLIFPGNWQVCISDPYAFCEHTFDLPVKGLLQEKEHFSDYWNKKNVKVAASGRSPLTWKSEMNILNLKNNSDLQKWFGHITSGIIFNIWGVDTMLMADGD